MWDDDLGWGIVVEPDERRPAWSDVAPAFDATGSALAVAWPDAGRVQIQSTPVAVVREPVKLLGLIERSIEEADDPLATAVEVGHAALLRSDGPRVFRVAWALAAWGCGSLLRRELAHLPEWLHRILTPLQEGLDWGTFARLRRRSDLLAGLLRSSPHVLARLAGAAAVLDFEDAVRRRRAEDAEDLRARLAIGLEQAATARGAEGAWRRFRARLRATERKYGRGARAFWAAQGRRGRALVAKRLDAVRRARDPDGGGRSR